jgi:hypothetical protein
MTEAKETAEHPTYYTTGVLKFFQKPIIPLKIAGTRRETCSKLHSEDP